LEIPTCGAEGFESLHFGVEVVRFDVEVHPLFGKLLHALDANPVRELTPHRRGRQTKKEKVNLTEETLAGLRCHLRGSDEAKKYDLVDLVDVLSGLGCRIGELLAPDWTKVDEKAETLAIEGTVIRVPRGG
jgi:integrase